MKESKEFAEQFIEKLDKKELCPKPELDMNDEFVEEEIDKYNLSNKSLTKHKNITNY